MPPFQSRSTGSFRIARIMSVGVAFAASTPSSARACEESAISLALRGNTPPPFEIVRVS